MSKPIFYIVEDDQLQAIEATLLDATGQPVNLTGASGVQLKYRQGPTVKTKNAEFVSKANGTVKYQWQVGDLTPHGDWEAHWCVTFPTGKPWTFPSDGYFTIRVTEKVA